MNLCGDGSDQQVVWTVSVVLRAVVKDGVSSRHEAALLHAAASLDRVRDNLADGGRDAAASDRLLDGLLCRLGDRPE